MANPIRSLSRVDRRPPAGANPALPEWANGDYVLERWVKEERQRRRNWLMDQRLHPSEPRPEWRPRNEIATRIKEPFLRIFSPINAATGNRLANLLWKSHVVFKWIVLPMWVSHYYVKYHLIAKPGRVITSNPSVYPDDPLHGTGGGGHH